MTLLCLTVKILPDEEFYYYLFILEMTEELEENPLYESLSREAAALKLRTEATEERMENLQERAVFRKLH